MDWQQAHEVELVDYDYSKNEKVSKGMVSLYLVAKSLSIKHVAYLLDNWVNLGGKGWREGLELGKLFQTTHRTLQGSLVNLCLGILCGLAETDLRWTDPRNEQAIKLAKQVKQVVDDNGIQPFI